MIKQITLYEQEYGFTETKNGVDLDVPIWYLCKDEIRKRFDLPKNNVVVTFTAYKNPGKNRIKVELDCAAIALDGKCHDNWQTETKEAIFKLLQKHGTFYIGCKYK